jgi:hypothetical protein
VAEAIVFCAVCCLSEGRANTVTKARLRTIADALVRLAIPLPAFALIAAILAIVAVGLTRLANTFAAATPHTRSLAIGSTADNKAAAQLVAE